MTKEQALILWDQLFLGAEVAYDYASHEIHRDDYQNDENGFGWDVDTKLPLSAGGTLAASNMTISSMLTKSIRGGRASFRIGNFSYQVRKGKRYNVFEIFDVTEPHSPVSMEPDKGNQDPHYNEARKRKSLEAKKTYSSASDFLSQFLKNRRKEEKTEEKPLFQAREEKEENKPIEKRQESSEEKIPVEETEGKIQEENKDAKWNFTNEKFEYERPQETFDKSKIVEHSEPIVAVTFQDNEAKFIKTEPFEENQWKDIDGRTDAIESVQDVKFLEKAKETSMNLVEEKTPDIDGIEETVKTAFQSESEMINARKDETEPKITSEEEPDDPKNLVEEKEEISPIASSVEDKNETEEEEDKIVETVKEEEKEAEPEKTASEEKPEQAAYNESSATEIDEDFDVDDDDTIVIPENSEAPDTNADIGGLLHKIESLKTLVHDLERKQKDADWKMNQLNVSFQTEKEENEKNKKEKEILSQNLDKANDELEKAKEISSSLENKVQTLEEESKSSKEEYERLSSELKQANEKLINSNQENKNKETQIISLNESRQSQQNQYVEITKKLSDVSLTLLESQKKEKELETEIQVKEDEIKTLNEEKENLTKNKEALETKVSDMDSDILKLNQASDELSNQIEKQKRYLLLSQCHIQEKYFDICLDYMRENQIYFSEENVYMALSFNPQWEKKENGNVIYAPQEEKKEEETLDDNRMVVTTVDEIDVSYLTREIEREKLALKLFKEVFGADVYETSDFAGRLIRYSEYKNGKSVYGWDFVRLDDNGQDSKDNIVIASLRSLTDFNRDEEFMTNGHRFKVLDKGDRKVLDSTEYITNPYNFTQAMSVVENECSKSVPLVYIFIKYTGIKSEIVSQDNQKKFNDLIERTVKRCCPNSYLQLQTIRDHTFITFDASIDGAYKEVYRYCILLNSYRTAFKRAKLINAIIILDELKAPIAYHHFTFEQLINELNDVDLRAIKYTVNNVSIVDSLIKRTVHVGPQIIKNIPVDPKTLVESKIGEGNFAIAYNFNEHFYEIPYIYEIMKK